MYHFYENLGKIALSKIFTGNHMKKIILLITTLLFFSVSILHAELNRILPIRLQPGDTVGLIAPAFRVVDEANINKAIERMEEMGLKVKIGDAVYLKNDIDGPHPGNAKERAEDINQMFKNPDIKAIIALRGGSGCSQLLEFIDYETIKQNPKIVLGFSDLTSLQLAMNAKTGLVTFHGPMPAHSRSWIDFSTNYVKNILFDADEISFTNPSDAQIITIKEGTATGKLLGGNLATLTSIVGSEYLPDFDGSILFIEDVGEKPYKMDRMLTHLKLAGILDKISGFIFGTCASCSPEKDDTLDSRKIIDIIKKHIVPLDIPAWSNSMIGHEYRIFTLPMGLEVEIDAATGTIKMLEPAVEQEEDFEPESNFEKEL